MDVSVSNKIHGSKYTFGIKISMPDKRMNIPPTVQLIMLPKTMMVNIPKHMTNSVFTSLLLKLKTEGPGLKPAMLSVAKIKKTAAIFPGIPRLNTGIRLAPDTAELAAYVAAIPSGKPVPNFSGWCDSFLATE